MSGNNRNDDVADVVAHRDESDVIDEFIDQHGIRTVSKFVDLAHDHSDGTTTVRIIADELDISRETSFDMLAEVQDILDITPEPKSTSGGDISQSEAEKIIDEARNEFDEGP
jgi:hypothetical protein